MVTVSARDQSKMSRCQELLEAALDQPSPTPELAEAIRAFVKPRLKPYKRISKPKPYVPAAPKPVGRKTERRIVTIPNPNQEECKLKTAPHNEWCREPGAYYGQWKQRARGGRVVFFSRPLCEKHGREYAKEYGLEVMQVSDIHAD